MAVALGAAPAGCGGSSPLRLLSRSSSAKSSGSKPAVPVVSPSAFSSDYSRMASLASLASAGRGKVAAILPGPTGSTGDGEVLDELAAVRKALLATGLPASDLVVQSTPGGDASQLRDADGDIADGAGVLIVDGLGGRAGAQIDSYAGAHGATVIDYDHLTPGAGARYYVGFGAAQAGTTIGEGFASCASAWQVSRPQVIVMRGAAADDAATILYHGYAGVLEPYFESGQYVDAASPAGTGDPVTALTQFEVAYTGHPSVNSALVPTDAAAALIIAYLQARGVKPRTFPITGQGATLTGLQNVLAGYQCGTVYEPDYVEAQAAAELALYVRAGTPPPAGLVNGMTEDPATGAVLPAVLLTPEWVTATNIDQTVVGEGYVAVTALCAGTYAADCRAAGIS